METVVKVDQGGLKGLIKYIIPTMKQKYEIMKDMYGIDENGKVVAKDTMESIIKMIGHLEKIVTQVKVKRDTLSIVTFDDFSRDIEGEKVIIELGKKILEGGPLGERSEPS